MSDPSAPHARILDRSVQKSRVIAFGLLAGVQVTLILAITVISIALPAIQRELGLTQGELALVSAAYGLSFSGLLLLGGRLADLFGRRRVLVAGLIMFGLASAAVGPASTLATLSAARFGQGIGAALAAPAAMALLDSVFPDPVRRTRAVAVWGGLAPVGAILGILLSGVAVTWMSWRWAFVVPVAVAAVIVSAAPRWLPEGPEPVPGRLDVLGALLATSGASALSYGLLMAAEEGWSSAAVLAPSVGGALVLAAFVLVESRTGEPLVPLSFFRSPRRVVALVAVLSAAAGTAALCFFLSLYFQQIRGLSALGTSAAFLPYGIALIGAGLVAGRLVGRLGTRAVTAAGLVLAAAGLLLVSRMGVDTPYAGALLSGLLVFPVGVALTLAGATVAAVDGVDEARAGLAGGVVNTALELGPTVGLALLVSLAGAHTAGLRDAGHGQATATTAGYAFALAATAVVFAVAGALVALGRRTRASRPECEIERTHRLIRGDAS